jgi:hypothetical protein
MGALVEVARISEVLISVMPESSWWGIRFLDDKFLQNWDWSPFIETYRTTSGFTVKMSGSCHIEPDLTDWQKTELGFIGWEVSEVFGCSCYASPFLQSSEEASLAVKSALEALYFIYGVSESCRLIGSNDDVNQLISKIPGIRFSRKSSAWYLSTGSRTRADLR